MENGMEIDKITGPLRELLREREIIARCELLLRTYDAVRAAKLTDQETIELKKMVGRREDCPRHLCQHYEQNAGLRSSRP